MVFLGHSFIQNIRAHVQKQIDFWGLRDALDENRVTIGRLNAFFLNLSLQFQDVFFRVCPFVNYYGGKALKPFPWDIATEILAINCLHPDIVCIALSSNDLARQDTLAEQVAVDLVAKARAIRASSGAKIVVLTSCLNRTKYYGGVELPDFEIRMKLFNTKLSDLCAFEPGVIYFRIAGFSFTKEGKPLPVEVWSADGTHPRPNSKYFDKFVQELRAASLRSLPALAHVLVGLGTLPATVPDYLRYLSPPPPSPRSGSSYDALNRSVGRRAELNL